MTSAAPKLTEKTLMWHWTIPGKPVAQARPRFARIGAGVRTYDKADVRDWKAYVMTTLASYRPAKPIEGAVKLMLTYDCVKPESWPKRRVHATTKPDLDNHIKLALDCLQQAGVLRNDSQVVEIRATKRLSDQWATHINVEILD